VSEQRAHIERIRKDFQASQRVRDSLNNSIQTLAQDLYSKETHFIFELIQNAEDNTYKETEPSLSFRLVKEDPTNTQNAAGALIIENNEIGFSPDNVDAICAVGKTTKSKIRGYIGEKGIGFKSVFRITAMPHIFSGGYRFCLPEEDKETGLGYIVPRWLGKRPKEIDPHHTTIILPLDKPDFGYEKIEEMLRDIEPETILFLSKLKEIQIRTDTGDRLTILKELAEEPLARILIEGERQGNSLSSIDEFSLYTKTVDKPQNVNHEKRVGIDKRDVSIAFPLDENKESAGKIFAYLPVRSDTGLPFLINADFILPSSREEIRGNVPWNEWLMKCAANLIADALPRLKERELLTVDLLEVLAKRMNELDENSIFYPIVEAVRGALMDQELLPTDEGTFVSARNAKLARVAELRELLTHDQLKELFQANDDIRWLSGEITQERTRDLHTYLMNELDVQEITPNGFAREVSLAFLENNQSDDWMVSFYRFLDGREALWKKGGHLRNKPFIRLRDGRYMPPFKDDGSPNVYLPPEADTEFSVVKPEIAKDEKVLEFLKKLGLTEPDAVAEAIEKIIPKYVQDLPRISDDEHLKDMTKIFRAYLTDSHKKKQQLISKLKGTAFIRAENPVLQQIEYKKPGQLYCRNEDLLLYFDGNKNAWFVNSEYDACFYDLFKDLGVGEAVRVKRNTPGRNRHVVIADFRGCHKRGLNGFDPDIEVDGLEYAVQYPTTKRSLFLWNNIAIPNSACIRGIVESSTRQTYEDSKRERKISEFGKILMNNPWLPDKEGHFHEPSEMELNDLPDSFIRDEALVDQLGMKKDVVAKLAEELRVSQDTIKLAQELEKQPPDIRKRIESMLQQQDGTQPEFPQRNSADPERRKKRIAKQIDEAPEKGYKPRMRSVRVTEATEYTRVWLKNQYTNQAGQMICQICKKEMPFRKDDGEYYFEAVEALSRDHFTREHEAQFLALCPLCAAMYKEFVKRDQEAMERLKDALIRSDDPEIPIQLGDRASTLRFVSTHFNDLKVILGKLEKDTD
jgi:hypothetical protein